TGDRGTVYKISPDGEGAPCYRTKSTHAAALAFDGACKLFVGTQWPGKVLRVDPEGRAFVLLDSPFQEIRALRFDDKGALYVAALSGRQGSGPPPPVTTDDRPERTTGPPGGRGGSVPCVSAEI